MASLQPKADILGRRLAAHLLRRTSFHYTKAQLASFALLSPDQALAQLFVMPTPSLPEPLDFQTGQAWINSGTLPISPNSQLRDFVRSWWTNEALQDPSIGHKMMFFLHSIFVVAVVEGPAAEYFDYLGLLRYSALGNLKTLAQKITIDNQMLRYLDNTQNNKNNPNENYAREFLELFTIGKGPQVGPGDYTNYTETDIIEAARLLSGFKIQPDRTLLDPDTGLPSGYANVNQHDTTDKTFSAAFQGSVIAGQSTEAGMVDELAAFVEMIFGQIETARTYCRKLYRFFVSPRIDAEIEADIIQPLAQTLFDNDYELQPVLIQLLSSIHFYDEDDADSQDEVIGSMIKSPLELLLHSLSYFQVPIPDPVTDPEEHYRRFYALALFNTFFPNAGMDLFKPADVAGYPAYYQEPDFHKNWFNSSSIITRYKLPEMLITGKRILTNQDLGTQLDIVHYVQNHVTLPANAAALVEEFLLDLFPEAVSPDRFSYYQNEMFLDGVPPYDWNLDWQAFISSGDDSEIRPPLESFLTALLYAQEFQAL